MVNINRYEGIKEDGKNADLNELIFDEEELSVAFEDVPDEEPSTEFGGPPLTPTE